MQGWKVYQASNVTDGKWNVKRKQVLGTSIPEQDQWVDSNLFSTSILKETLSHKVLNFF